MPRACAPYRVGPGDLHRVGDAMGRVAGLSSPPGLCHRLRGSRHGSRGPGGLRALSNSLDHHRGSAGSSCHSLRSRPSGTSVEKQRERKRKIPCPAWPPASAKDQEQPRAIESDGAQQAPSRPGTPVQRFHCVPTTAPSTGSLSPSPRDFLWLRGKVPHKFLAGTALG